MHSLVALHVKATQVTHGVLEKVGATFLSSSSFSAFSEAFV